MRNEAGPDAEVYRKRVTNVKPSQTANDKRSTATWRYDEGILTVRYLGEKVSLGRYATHEHAAKAAAAYFANHDRGDLSR